MSNAEESRYETKNTADNRDTGQDIAKDCTQLRVWLSEMKQEKISTP